jgi:transitional endoplasmic reticulum ATPase
MGEDNTTPRNQEKVRLAIKINDERVNPDKYLKDVNELTVAPKSGEPTHSAKYEYSLDEENVHAWDVYDFEITELDGKTAEMTLVADIKDGLFPDFLPQEGEKSVLDVELLGNTRPATVNNVSGLDDEKKELRRFLSGTDEDLGIAEPTGIILEGPPGTGKTELVREVCQEMYGAIPVTISGPEILNKWVGGSERLLRQKFEEARNSEARVLYIDELDAIAQSRSDTSESYSAQIVAQLLVLLDGVESKNLSERVDRPLKIIGATNISHVIDPALKRPGRLGNRPISFGYPDQGQRKAIFHHYLSNIYTSEDGRKRLERLKDAVLGNDDQVLEELSEFTEGSTGADIWDLVQESARRAQDEEKSIDADLIEDTYHDGEFESRWTASEEVIESQPSRTSGYQDQDDVTIRHRGPTVYPLNLSSTEEDREDTAKEIAKHHFSEQDVDEFTFRVVSPKDIFDSDDARAHEHIVQAFNSNGERVALYLQDAEALLKVSHTSSRIQDLVGVLNEQLLQWDSDNLLLVSDEAADII